VPTSSSSSSVASQDNRTTTIVVAFSSTTSSTPSSSDPGSGFTSSVNSSYAIVATDPASSATSSSSVLVQTITASILSSVSAPVQGSTSSTANFTASTNNTTGGSATSSLSSALSTDKAAGSPTNITSVVASVATGNATSYPVLVTIYTASGQGQTSSIGPNNTANATLEGSQTPTSGPLSGTSMSDPYLSSAGTASLGFLSQANATGAPGTLLYSLVLPSTSASGGLQNLSSAGTASLGFPSLANATGAPGTLLYSLVLPSTSAFDPTSASQYLSSAGTAVSGFPFRVNATGVPGTLVYSLILSSTRASGFASASGTGAYGYGMSPPFGSYNSSTVVDPGVSQVSGGIISGSYPSAQMTSSPLANGSGNSSILCYAGNATTTGQNVTVTCVPGTINTLSSGGVLQQGSTLPTGTSVDPGSYPSAAPSAVPVFVPQYGGSPGSASSGETTIVVTLTLTRCGACANSATGIPNSLSSGATLPATGVVVSTGPSTFSASGSDSGLASQPGSTPFVDLSGPATVVVSLTMTQCGACTRTSVVPVYTPGMLGNAYGGGYISTPSVYVTVTSPSASGSAVGVPPGYGYSAQPGALTAGSQSVSNSAVPASPVSAAGSSGGSPQASGLSIISGTTTTTVQPGSPTASVYSSAVPTSPGVFPAGSSVGSPQGFGYSSQSGIPTAGSQSVYDSAVSASQVSSTASPVGSPQGSGFTLISGTTTTTVQPGSPTLSVSSSAVLAAPVSAGSSVGSPQGYGSSLVAGTTTTTTVQPGSPTAPASSSAVSTSPVTSAGSSVGSPQGYGSSLIAGPITTTVQPGSSTGLGAPTSIGQVGGATVSGQSSHVSTPSASVVASSAPSVSSEQGYGYSFVPGNPTPVLVPIPGTAVGTPTTVVETATQTLPGQSPYTSIVLTLPAAPSGYGYSPQIGGSSGSGIQIGPATGSGSSAGSTGASNSNSTSSVAPGGLANNGGIAPLSGGTPYPGSVNSGNISVPVNPSALATYEGSATRYSAMDMFQVLLVCLVAVYML